MRVDPGALVSSVARFTLMNPRSVSWTPASLSPRSSVLTARPGGHQDLFDLERFGLAAGLDLERHLVLGRPSPS